MRRWMWGFVGILVNAFVASPESVWATEPAAPTPVAALRRALQAAGGMEALRELAVVKLMVDREEVTNDGALHKRQITYYMRVPGPTPGRLEDAAAKLVAGDDGEKGWAHVDRQPDLRPSTQIMVKRILTTALFPVFLPFSLTWEGVAIEGVEARQLEGRPSWLLAVRVPRNFFHTPQIATQWQVYLDAATYEVVRAESPHVDLGHGLAADGMRFSWPKDTEFHGVRLPAMIRVVGLDEANQEKAHTRLDRISITRVPPQEAEKLFANPFPQSKPNLPAPPPPARPSRGGA